MTGLSGLVPACSTFMFHLKVKIMTTKERIKMLEGWVKEINPKAFLHHADARCGGIYAIAVRNGSCVTPLSQFMTPKEMEKVLMFAFNNDLQKIKNA